MPLLRPDDDAIQAVVEKFDATTGFLLTQSDVGEEPMGISSSSSAFPKETGTGGTEEMFPDVDEKMKEKKPSKPAKLAKKETKKDSKKVKKHHKK